MKKLIIILISLLSISGSLTAKVKYSHGKWVFIDEKVLHLKYMTFVGGLPYSPDKENTLKKGEEPYPFKNLKLDEENYIYLDDECFYRTDSITLNRHYTGYSKTNNTTKSHYTIRPKYQIIIDVLERNWDKELHGIDYCKLSQEDRLFVTYYFSNAMMKQYVRILSPMTIPEVIAAFNINIADEELADLNLNDEDPMINIERLLQYWFEPHCRPKISFKTTRL